MTSVVVPIRGLGTSKSRLRGYVSPSQCQSLVAAMLNDVLSAISNADLGQVFVVSADPDVALISTKYGANLVLEKKPTDYNEAVNNALKHLPGHEVLIVPADLPALTSKDIAKLVPSTGQKRAVVHIAPDLNMTGTNAIFLPDFRGFEFQFGPGSFARHQRSARVCNLECQTVSEFGLALDIDTPSDVSRLLSISAQSRTAHLLRSFGFTETSFGEGIGA
ncbi:MAG: 2-phospho-L-lactate guanylyltransferase [Pseudomonadota bacterium]